MYAAPSARTSYQNVAISTQTAQASPHRLIELLYDELIASLRQASFAVGKGDLARKSASVSRALTILNGLQSSLDTARGGEVAQTLASVYRYAVREIGAGNIANDAARFDAAGEVLGEMADAWRQIRP